MLDIDAKTLDMLLSHIRQRSSVFFSAEGLDITFETGMIEVEDSCLVLENRVKPEYINAVCSATQFLLQCRMIRFGSASIKTDGEHILFPLSQKSIIEETRTTERFPFTAEERVICEILNPFDGETKLSKSVMDMSATGLSIRTSYDSKLFQPGTLFKSMRVLIDGEPYSQNPGRVVYGRKLLDLKGKLRLQVGIKFEPAAPKGSEH